MAVSLLYEVFILSLAGIFYILIPGRILYGVIRNQDGQWKTNLIALVGYSVVAGLCALAFFSPT